MSALFVSVLQTGAAAGIAIVTSIQTSVEKHTVAGPMGFEGRAAGLWFLVAFDGVMGLLLLVFMIRRKPTPPPAVTDEESESSSIERNSQKESKTEKS